MTIESPLAASLYRAAETGTRPSAPLPREGDNTSFADALQEAARALETTLREGDAAAKAAVSGQGDVQTLVEAITATELAVETAVTVRDRVVEAYQELLRMPV